MNNFSDEKFKENIVETHKSEIQSKRGVLSEASRYKENLEERQPWVKLSISRRKYFFKSRGEVL